MKFTLNCLFAVSLAILSAGQQVTFSPANAIPDAIIVLLNPQTIPVGGTSVATAQFSSGGVGGSFATYQCSWLSSDPSKATITLVNGLWTVTGIGVGTASISCTAGNQLGGSGVTGSATITVNAPPQITNPPAGCTQPCTLPPGTNGSAYSFTFTASGGVLPYTWSLVTGACLSGSGLTLSSGGVLSGTAVTGTYSCTVKVTDNIAQNTQVSVSLTINAAVGCSPPSCYNSREDVTVSSGSTVNSGNPPAALMGVNCATPGACACPPDCVVDDNNSGPAAGYMIRIADFTNVGSGNFLRTYSSGTARQWSWDSKIVSGVYSLQSATAFISRTLASPPVFALKGNAIQDKNGLSFGAEVNHSHNACSVPTCGTSAATSYLFFGAGTTGGFPNRITLNKYVLDTLNAAWTGSTGLGQNLAAAITGTVLADPFTFTGLTSYMTGQDGQFWNKWMAAGNGDQTADMVDSWSCLLYRFQQDAGSLVACTNMQTGGYEWLDVKTGQYCSNVVGHCGTMTGFGPLPTPATPTVTWSATGGTLDCTKSYIIWPSYSVIGANGYGGESQPSQSAPLFNPGGTGSACKFTVTAPVANPGGGTGINGPVTATGYNTYACQGHLQGPLQLATCDSPVNFLPQTPVGGIAAPVISTVAGCTAGGQNYTVKYWAVARSGSGSTLTTSVPSMSVSAAVTSNTTPGCTVTLTNPVPSGLNVDILRDDISMNVCTIAAGGTNCKDSNQNPKPYALQTNLIGANATYTSLANTTDWLGPAVGGAGVLIHNIRIDQGGNGIQLAITDAFQAAQGNAPNAPTQLSYQFGSGHLVAWRQNQQTCNGSGAYDGQVSYAAAHWATANNALIDWPGSTGRTKGIRVTLGNSCATINTGQVFMNAANGGLDTQSNDQHLNHDNAITTSISPMNPDTPVTRNAYSNGAAAYQLPPVPYNKELSMWQDNIAISSISGDGTTTTVTTSINHGMPTSCNSAPSGTGCNVTILGTSNSAFNGVANHINVTDATHFTYASSVNGSSTGGVLDRPMIRGCHIWTSAQEGANAQPKGAISPDGKIFFTESDMQVNANGLQGTASVGVGSKTGTATCTLGGTGNCNWYPYACEIK